MFRAGEGAGAGAVAVAASVRTHEFVARGRSEPSPAPAPRQPCSDALGGGEWSNHPTRIKRGAVHERSAKRRGQSLSATCLLLEALGTSMLHDLLTGWSQRWTASGEHSTKTQ